MTQTPRRSLTWLSVASLLAFVAVSGVWVRSYWRCDTFAPVHEPNLVTFQSYRGAVHFLKLSARNVAASNVALPTETWASPRVAKVHLWQQWNGPPIESYTLLGFGFITSLNAYTIAAVPYWCPAALTLILPLWWLPRWSYWHRYRSGRCPKCGHDLKREKERCPSCGRMIGGRITTMPPPTPRTEPPRPAKKVHSVVIDSATQDRNHSPPTDDSGPAA